VKTKSPSESEVIRTEIVYPDDTNPMGVLNGGRIVEWMDTTSAICAQIHTGHVCVTAGIDRVTFQHPAQLGDIISIRAKVTRAFKRSLEILAQAESIEIDSSKRLLITSAFFTFVVTNQDIGTINQVRVVTSDEKREYEEALRRREQRQESKRA